MHVFSQRSMALALLTLLAATLLMACQPVQPVAETDMASAQTEYRDPDGFFTASYPQGWVSDPDLFSDMPFPGAMLATSNEILELSMVNELLPEEEIGVALILMPAALFAEMGLAEDAPLDEVLRAVLLGMSDEDEAEMAEELMANATIEQFTLANGAPAVRSIVDGVTESYDMTVADLGDGVILFAPQITALGYRNAELEGQVDAILDSFELTASSEDVLNHVMAQMGGEMGASAPTLAIDAREYAYDGPESVPGGLTRIELTNQGEQAHGIFLVKLEDGKTVDDLMGVFAAMESDPAIPDWLVLYGGVEAAPGQSAAYIIDLAPGSYAYFSFSTDEEEVPDFAKGMLGTLTVTEAVDSGAVPPQADVHVEMVDFSYVIDGEFRAGPQVVEVTNTGTEAHESVLFKLAEGAGVQDVVDFLMAEDFDGPPPFAPHGTIGPMNPGMTAWYEVDLDSGEYGLVCFIPSAANEGAPHLVLGMVRQVAVP